MKQSLFIIFINILFLHLVNAQIEETAPINNPLLKNLKLEQNNNNSFLGGTDTLGLPFLDDFSYEGPYPSMSNWCDNHVFVNNTISYQPPSIGVATMDGLSSSGAAYSENLSGDYLTSKPFYLGTYSNTDNVHLSYFFQAKGLGDKPELEDSLVVEFKDINDNWNIMMSYNGIDGSVFPSSYIPAFEFDSIKIPQDYLYDGFQFRFRNITSGLGQVDLWHLDYIRLTANVIPTLNFSDVAFTQQATSFLKNYSSMPWDHFEGNESEELTDEYSVSLYNHFQVTQEITNRVLNITETTTNTNVLSSNYLTDSDAPIPLGNVDAGVHLTATKNINTNDYSTFESNMSSSFSGAEYLEFESEFSFVQSGQDPAFPASFDNDLAKRKTIFDNYFAYDDGTAESNVKAQNPGTQVAVQFHMNKPDSIVAIQMHIPHVAGDVTLQLFNLKIWTDLDSDPIYEDIFEKPVYVDDYYADTLQGFTTYTLKNDLGEDQPIFLNVESFYVGWQQVTDTETPIPVGFDKNTPQAGIYNFYNTGGEWQPFPETLQGAILLRTVVTSNKSVFTTPNEEISNELKIEVFPNPASDIIHLQTHSELQNGQITISDYLGRTVLSQSFQNELNINHLANGIYHLEISSDSNQSYITKLVIQR